MILENEIEVLLHGVNIPYYKNLGYTVPVRTYKGKDYIPNGTKILVKISDLPKSSKTLVTAICDNCGEKKKIFYGDYLHTLHKDKHYCHKCASIVLTSGKLNYNWNFEKTQEERMKGRKYPEYHKFVLNVLERDDYKCLKCGKQKNLQVHHLYSFTNNKDKRTDTDNGVTLCASCHNNFHYKYGFGNNTLEQFYEWFGDKILIEKHESETCFGRKVICHETQEIFDSAIVFSRKYKVDMATCYLICNHGCKKSGSKIYSIKGLHIFYLNEYINLSQDELDDYINHKSKTLKRVRCITTGEIFDSMANATKKYNLYSSAVSACCRNKQKTAGMLNGIPLEWEYC